MEIKIYVFCVLVCILHLASQNVYMRKRQEQEQQQQQPEFFNKAAVVTNSFDCTCIGLDILKRGGSAADAAIAALLCEGVTNPQSLGLGGGFLLTIYTKRKGKAQVLDARECAPSCATKDMFTETSTNDMASGGLSVAVPAELKGYWELHRKYGKLEWCDLFKPTIKLLQRGIYVNGYLADIIKSLAVEIISSPTLKAIFFNRETGQLYKEGELMTRPKLIETLARIAEKGPDYLYNGPLTDCFLQDIKDHGGIITREDLKKYKPRWMKPLSTILNKELLVYTTPSPGAGCPLLVILDVMSKMIGTSPLVFWQRLIETWKYAYGLKTQLSGPLLSQRKIKDHSYNCSITEYIRCKIKDSKTCNDTSHYFGVYEQVEDHGTGHVNILAPNGDAVSVTSTINLCFGALFASPSTGIILNNQMMDFAIPGHHPWKANPANYIQPYKQPSSTMCPTIIVNQHDDTVRMVIGASGGFKILSSTSLVIIKHLLLDEPIERTVNSPRLHHQLKPMVVEYEEGFPRDILRGLAKIGHCIKKFDTRGGQHKGGVVSMPVNSAVNVIAVKNGEIHAVGDCRRMAIADGY